MDFRRQDNGLLTFLEHWSFILCVLIAFLTSKILEYFSRLCGAPWIWFFVASFVLMSVGGCLIFYAKLPVYRSGRFFRFGAKSIPERLQRVYWWGWQAFSFGVVLELCLLLSKP